ncbi:MULTISPECIES: ABC-three component system protein [Bacillus subtilis group]|nr:MULTISPECIES: ABC-three component system protein [Bacillus subtilis group]MED1068055.1 SMEK domain-containing protein [Bacillus paralicheniformis]MED4810392.1 SMEK domain-containing protein [Bacillus atrophaeus]
MNRPRYYDYIHEKLEVLAQRITTNGKLNLLHLNIHSETLYRELLSILYEYKLQPSNIGKANAEAIDLIDEDKKVVVQVSSTATKAKINSTLGKDKIKELSEEGYRIKFVFVANIAGNLRGNTYNNIYNISFDPNNDIWDKITVMEKISQLTIDKMTSVHDLIQKEFGERPGILKLSSNLAAIVNFLSKENLYDVTNSIQLNDYGIEEKIEFNELNDIKESTFDEYKIYYGMLERIYKEFNREGSNKAVSVLRKITSFYEKEVLNKESTNVEKFLNVIGKVQEHVLQSELVKEIPEEEIDMCIRIIVVDAFVRCKIFKNPRGYTHVAT